jgi:sulfide:quinone oxidoreductase
LKEFFSNPGPVVIWTIPGTSCFGPAYEFTFMMKYELSKRRLRVTIAKLTKVEKDRVYYEDINGNVYEQEAKFTMFMPRFSGPDVVSTAGEQVANPTNKMVIVDKCFQNPTFRNIYGVGVVTFIPPVEKTPVPTGLPKTGQMIEGMALAVSLNIINDIKNTGKRYTPTLVAICMADMGSEGTAFVANPAIPPIIFTKAYRAKNVVFLKKSFERYFLWKVKHGDISPWFEEKFLHFVWHFDLVQEYSE